MPSANSLRVPASRVPGAAVLTGREIVPAALAGLAKGWNDRYMRGSRTLTVGMATGALGLIALAFVLEAMADSYGDSWVKMALGTLAVVSSASVGILIARRRPENPIAALLAANALTIATIGFLDAYAAYAVLAEPGSLPGGRMAVLLGDALWPMLFAGVTAIAFVFPDGRLPSRGWRPVAWVACGVFAGLVVLQLFSPEPFEGRFEDVESPLPELGEWTSALSGLFILGMLATLLAAAVAIRTRLRRARGVERLQVQWLAYAACLIPITLLVCMVGAVGLDSDLLVFASLALTAIAVPVAVGIAVLRYRLYEIDRVVNRTLVYGGLTFMAGALYGAVILVAGTFAAGDSVGVALVATGAVAAAVQPLHGLLQRRVNRLMYGDREDPYAALSRLAERLGGSIQPQVTLATIARSVAEALRLPWVAIELAREHEFERVSSHGTRGRGETMDIPLVYGGETVGRLLVESRGPDEPLGEPDRRLLEDLARHAAAAVRAIRLTADLQISRERLVTAREEERRRVRRDLHDGLGPTLAGVVLQLDTARGLVADDPQAADALLSELRATTQEAIADIRRLVYELRPPALDELGLVAAIEEHAARLNNNGDGVRVTIRTSADLNGLPAAVEVAAYRIALEAITNVTRHAQARTCDVRVTLNGDLEIEVADDGHSKPAEFRAGVGIRSMSERAGELGGTLTVGPAPGGGTCVRATLPLGSS